MEKFGLCLNCTDGKVQLPVIVSIISNFKYSLRNKRSEIIFVVGHSECDMTLNKNGNGKEQLLSAVGRVKTLDLESNGVGLWGSKIRIVKIH